MADETVTVPAEQAKIAEKAQRLEAQLVDVQKQLERYKGIDPDAVKSMREDYELLRKESAAGDPKKIEKLLSDKESELNKRYGEKLTEYETRVKQSESELKNLRVTNVAMQKAASLFTDDSLYFVKREVEQACDWDNGDIVVRGADGKPLPSKNDPRQNMGIEEYLTTLASKHPSIAKSNATGGTLKPGTTKPATTNGAMSVEAFKALTPAEMSKLPMELRQAMHKQILSGVKPN